MAILPNFTPLGVTSLQEQWRCGAGRTWRAYCLSKTCRAKVVVKNGRLIGIGTHLSFDEFFLMQAGDEKCGSVLSLWSRSLFLAF